MAASRADREEEEFHVWQKFSQQVNAVRSSADLTEVFENWPEVDAPGRPFYSNLDFFLHNAIVPDGASVDELEMYRDLLNRISSELKPDFVQRMTAGLKHRLGR